MAARDEHNSNNYYAYYLPSDSHPNDRRESPRSAATDQQRLGPAPRPDVAWTASGAPQSAASYYAENPFPQNLPPLPDLRRGSIAATSGSSGGRGPSNASSTSGDGSSGSATYSSSRSMSNAPVAGPFTTAPPEATSPGAQTTDKACKKCRERKVKCDRHWPRCKRCIDRGDACDFGSMVPRDVVENISALSQDVQRVPELEQQIALLQHQLAGSERQRQRSRSPVTPSSPVLLASVVETIRQAYLTGATAPQISDSFIASTAQMVYSWGGTASSWMGGIGETSVGWQLTRLQLATALSLHLVNSFFTSCCGYLAVFDSWHIRLPWICENINNLNKADQVAVAGFCAMGARASPHSALLGIDCNSPIQEGEPYAATLTAGVRREQACRALHQRTMELSFALEIAHDASVCSLETLLVQLQMLIFNELIPRKSRSVLRLSFGMFQDIMNSALPATTKEDLVQRVGLPLFNMDGVTAAYARKAPVITDADLRRYLPEFAPINFAIKDIQQRLHQLLPPTATRAEINHERISAATRQVVAWLAYAQRMFAELSVSRLTTALLSAEIYSIWAILDQIHASVQSMQELLVNLDFVPFHCDADGCNDLHLRFVTRSDRDSMDISFLLQTFIQAKLESRELIGGLGAALLAESEKRVRKALKLVAFYSELYMASRDHHMTYHLVWQLELLPEWTTLALQRFGERGGPATVDLECTEAEIDWYLKGTACAAYYHPVANSRLAELKEHRRAPRQEPYGVPPAFVQPSELRAQARGPPYGAAVPPSNADVHRMDQDFDTSMDTFQTGVTDPNASKVWGDWTGRMDLPGYP